MNSFNRIISLIIGILLMFLASQLYFSLKEDTFTQEIIQEETTHLSNEICEHGYLTESMLDDYRKRINCTGNLYELSILHEELCHEPEYRFKTVEEIIEDQNKRYTGTNVYTYVDVNTEKPVVTEQEPTHLVMNEDTNSSVLARSTINPSSPTHSHSSACFSSSKDNTKLIIKKRVDSTSYYGNTTTDIYEIICDHCGEILYTLNETSFTDCQQRRWSLICWGLDNNPSTANYTLTFYNEWPAYDGTTHPAFQTGLGTKADQFLYAMVMTLTGNYTSNSYMYDYQFIGGHQMVGDGYHTSTYVAETTWEELKQKVINNGYQGKATIGGMHVGLCEQCPFVCQKDYMTTTSSCNGTLECINYLGNEIKLYDKYATYYVEEYGSYTQRTETTAPFLLWTTYRCKACGDYLVLVYISKPLDLSYSYCLYNSSYLIVLDHNYYTSNSQVNTYMTKLKDYIQTRGVFSLDPYSSGVYYGEENLYNVMGDYLKTIPHAQVSLTANSPYVMIPSMKTISSAYFTSMDGKYKLNYQFIDRSFTFDGLKITSTVLNPAKHYSMAKGICLCDQIITNIVPTHLIQNIYVGDQEHFVTTATIYYLDGSTKVAVCDSTFQVNHVGNMQIATLSYYGLYNARDYKTFTANVTVNVVAKSRSCANGHTYWLSADGSDPGCPYCRAWLRNLTFAYPLTPEIEIVQGTTLESNGVILIATYLDGHVENLTSGYVHNLDNIYIGNQTVTISYKGKYLSLKVTTKKRKKQCTICGKYYEIYPDGTDPGCPYCMALVPVFTGNVLTYYNEHSTKEIFDEINSYGSYKMVSGDEIKVEVECKNKTFAQRLLNYFGIRASDNIHVWNSSEVRDKK